MKLHLGVKNVNYAIGDEVRNTGFVGTLLEEHYHVMAVFFEAHKEEIAAIMAEKMRGMLYLPEGEKIDILEFPKIKELFSEYLEKREWKQITGMTIAAAEGGHRHSHKSVTGNNKRSRAEFVDTHKYKNSMMAWFE